MNILHLKSLAVNIIVATKFILYVKKKKEKKTGWLCWICGQVICLMCASGKFICVLFLYMVQAGRQGGKQQTVATNHGYSPNDTLQLQIQNPKLSFASLALFSPALEITLESDVMHRLNHMKYIRYDPYRKGKNNNPVAFQLVPWKKQLFPHDVFSLVPLLY